MGGAGAGNARTAKARLPSRAGHYLSGPGSCHPASGWGKGQIGKSGQDARRRLWQPLPNFANLDGLNAWLEERCIAQWGQIVHGNLPGSVADAHAG